MSQDNYKCYLVVKKRKRGYYVYILGRGLSTLWKAWELEHDYQRSEADFYTDDTRKMSGQSQWEAQPQVGRGIRTALKNIHSGWITKKMSRHN